MVDMKIMVVDDEVELAELIKDYLEEERYSVMISTNGKEAVEMFRTHQPNLVVLDIMLPVLDGMEVCRTIRSESNVPIIMLSAKKADVDKIVGLGLGADDYIVKPFSPGEVVARVKAQLRRYHMLSSAETPKELLRFNKMEIDLKGYTVAMNGKPIEFTAKEFEILRLLALHPGQVLTREQIIENVWGFNHIGDLNTVTVHIKKIREKIEINLSNPQYIKTVWGVGYRFDGGKK
ncbi:response regulator transcription factor [Paenibacillus doosanensis]|uniref:Transcriptional regulatory protein YycF n=1 Tax=Paenibacillus konkukensis TaxID=2020716 RepID=A0ABY4RZ74_9BACL|nr:MULTISPECIES: response regulator transcription factor [Paenibacillus]MCS7460387.1 response regulator transcription factor [Paenibacillus doosanensis]UQZ87437.1 Transcriptional regulatory protein YycF [Paenibacillus konkukensis]